MAKKTQTEVEGLLKTSFHTVIGNRTSGYDAEDAQQIVTSLLSVITDKAGNDITLSPERLDKIEAALAITPKRITKLIKAELEAAGGVVEEHVEEKILWLVDLLKVRHDLVEGGILEKPGKGKQAKKKVVDLLK